MAAIASLARVVFLAHIVLLEASEEPSPDDQLIEEAPVGTYIGTQVVPGAGCAEYGAVFDSTSAAFETCTDDYETCFGVYSPTCDEGPYTLCNRVAGGDDTVTPAPDAEGCVAQVVVVTAAPTPAPTPVPTDPQQLAAAVAATPAPTAAPQAATPAPTVSFDVINAYDCDTMTCTLPGHEPESCRHHMEDLMKGGHGDAGSMPRTSLTCEAARKVLLQSPTCKDCFPCDLCEKNVTGNLATQRLYQDRHQQLQPAGRAAAAGATAAGLHLRAPALAVAAVMASAGVASLVLLTIKLSRRTQTAPRREPVLREGMGYTDALAMEEEAAFCVE